MQRQVMNFQQLPPEIIAKCLGHARTHAVAKVRKTCHGMNKIVERYNLQKAVVHKATIMNRNDQSIEFLENEVIVNIELDFDPSKGSIVRCKDLIRLKYDEKLPDMGEVYEKLFSEVRRAETLSAYGIDFDGRFRERSRRHKFESKNTVFVASDCTMNLSVIEAIQLFGDFKKVELRDCRLAEILMCDEVFAEIIAQEVDLMLHHYGSLQTATLITDQTLVILQKSPWFARSMIDIETTKTKFTLAAITRLILNVANMNTHHSMDLNFGYLDDSERNGANYYIDTLREHPRISIVHSDSEMRYIYVVVEDEDEQPGVEYSKSDFRIQIGNIMYDVGIRLDVDVWEI